ncbi:MAG: alpha-1,2-fucosyltransferase [Nitrosomonadales bacterium]|nr:alpha-1,2-fucosyltransferase [Nitrosomonadales bacterium]
MNINAQQFPETAVTFTGGLGAQIFSAAIYYHLKSKGHTVYADMDYFKQPAKIAPVGNMGEISLWNYELEEYGLPFAGFATKTFEKSFFKLKKHHVILDGPEKFALAIEALRQQAIKKLFPIASSIIEECHQISGGDDYLCIHIRRGDYVNVASHMVDDTDFINLAKSISGFVTKVIVISDSEVSDTIKESLPNLYKQCSFIVGGNLHIAHALIRQAKYLICSNSQFSLSAALLNEIAQQVFLPTKWSGDDNSSIQKPINALCRFQILNIQ